MKWPVMQDTDNDSVGVAVKALGTCIARLTEQGELHASAIPGLTLFRREEPSKPATGVYEPSVCLVAQEAKRLLVGDQGGRLRQIASAGSQSHQIARAIDWLKGNFSQPLRIDDLAAEVRMSSSTFHHHFRSMTALSPPQYQKQLRLQGILGTPYLITSTPPT